MSDDEEPTSGTEGLSNQILSTPTETLESLVAREEIEDIKSDRTLRERYAHWFIWILLVQLAVMNVVLILDGLGILYYVPTTLHFYMTGTLAEVFGVVLVITRYLFSRKHAH